MATKNEENWYHNYEALKAYISERGHLPDKHVVENRALLSWAKYQSEVDEPKKHYGEILVMFETLLNYLTAILFQKEAESIEEEVNRVRKLINSLKCSLFKICDVHERTTSERDLKRIEEKGFKDAFATNKYLFHEKFLKSLMQRPLHLQRANIFTSNYDLAFEYAFDNIGIKYIDGFSGEVNPQSWTGSLQYCHAICPDLSRSIVSLCHLLTIPLP